MDIVAQIKADPFGAIAGMYNIKTHLHQMQAVPGTDLLWSSNTQETRPLSPPEYHAKYEAGPSDTASTSKIFTPLNSLPEKSQPFTMKKPPAETTPEKQIVPSQMSQVTAPRPVQISQVNSASAPRPVQISQGNSVPRPITKPEHVKTVKRQPVQSPRFSMRPLSGNYSVKNPVYKVYDNGDCCLDPRLPSIDEHSNTDVTDKKAVRKSTRTACVRKANEVEAPRLASCPARNGDAKRSEFYRKGGDGIPR